jgi:Protein of unknown function (DUF2505)
MPRQIDYQSTFPCPAEQVFTTMVDPDFLRERLAAIGGPGAALLEHHRDADGARYRIRHGIDPGTMPAVVRTVLPGSITVERTEDWTHRNAGQYLGDVQVSIGSAPASASGGMRLRDVPDSGSELQIRIDASVHVPLIGGKVEDVVVGGIRTLLDMETDFTRRWLSGQR